eukprot:scpid87790/ scgid13491/ Ectoine hydroxylase
MLRHYVSQAQRLASCVGVQWRCLSANPSSPLPAGTDYLYDGGRLDVSGAMKSAFEENGFVVFRNMLSTAELARVRLGLEDNGAIMQESIAVADGTGRQSRMCLWNQPGTDVTGMVGRAEKVAGTMEQLLGGEVYHYHTKLMMKEAYTGGAFVWHQDYGYWYMNGCLYPHMATAFIAVDMCKKENGCMQVIPGSNLLGRIEHLRVAGQTGADAERIELIKKRLDEVYVEMEPGDALFFHSLLLHKSNENSSPNRRWAFLCAYNRASNDPLLPHHHPQYTPLEKVANGAIMECENFSDLSGKDFLQPGTDKTSEGKR